MVKIADVRARNAEFTVQGHSGLVCLFAGATAGIGAATLREMVVMVQSSTFYILGRDVSRHNAQLDVLRQLNPTNSVIFIDTLVSLISGIDKASKQIIASEEKVDIICVSPGGMPFQGPVYTKEGLETCFAVSYYSRLRLISNLLPLLHRSSSPRILSILNGSKEKRINEQDTGLESSWGITAVVNHTTLMTSLAFDHIVDNNQKGITLLHATPGFVHTKTPRTAYPSRADGLARWALLSFLQIVSGWIIRYFGMRAEESGERHAYELTSTDFVAGSWRIDRLNEVVSDNPILLDYKRKGWAEKIWEFTNQVWEKAVVDGNKP